jgi:hypothetical protein
MAPASQPSPPSGTTREELPSWHESLAAEPIAYLNSWSIDFTVNFINVTAFGDTSMTYVSGLPDTKGAFGGFYDTATAQLYTAATDGVARKMYLYPDNGSTGQYWFGTGLFDFSISSGVDDAVSVSGNWSAASVIAKVG